MWEFVGTHPLRQCYCPSGIRLSENFLWLSDVLYLFLGMGKPNRTQNFAHNSTKINKPAKFELHNKTEDDHIKNDNLLFF